jgi:hypothetical protein
MEVINLAPETIEFHAIIEQEVVNMEYGQMTVNVQIEDGKPILKSLSLVKSKRKKYTIDSNKNML